MFVFVKFEGSTNCAVVGVNFTVMLKSNYSLIKVRSCSREYYRAKGVYFPLPMIRNNPKHLTFVLTPTPTYGYILHCTRCMHKKKKGKGKKGDYNYILG